MKQLTHQKASISVINPQKIPNESLATDAFEDVTDEQLYRMCQRFGEQAKYWRQRFIGLLPEANRRYLYEKKGFSSIFEFAYKLAGLSEEQVRRALNL